MAVEASQCDAGALGTGGGVGVVMEYSYAEVCSTRCTVQLQVHEGKKVWQIPVNDSGSSAGYRRGGGVADECECQWQHHAAMQQRWVQEGGEVWRMSVKGCGSNAREEVWQRKCEGQ